MLNPGEFLDLLTRNKIRFFCGVPDSLLKHFCACVESRISARQHIIAANEGAAIGLAIGHHLATGAVPLVYLQNSGLGNTVNPILSLASPEVYGVPMLLLIGWRGEPGVKDEPQHIHQGRLTDKLLDVMDVPYFILDIHDDLDSATGKIKKVLKSAREKNGPVAVLVRKGTFENFAYSSKPLKGKIYLERESAVMIVAEQCEPNALIVCTTGMLSRELFEYRVRSKQGHARDFLSVGGMGHALQIATAIAIEKPKRPVYCFDGDGAALMHMGSLAVTASQNPGNLTHILFNNGCHESVGGQPTAAHSIRFKKVAKAVGYKSRATVSTEKEIIKALRKARAKKGIGFIQILVLPGHRDNIGRPTTTPAENKHALMQYILK